MGTGTRNTRESKTEYTEGYHKRRHRGGEVKHRQQVNIRQSDRRGNRQEDKEKMTFKNKRTVTMFHFQHL